MSGSFRVCRLFGIDLKIHASFFLLPAGFAFFYARDYGAAVGARMFTLVLLVFLCVLGHELTHSFQARRFGIAVSQITLYPIGGIAGMQRVPRDPAQELSISIVGPLFNFALAAVLFAPLYGWLGPANLFSPSLDSWPRTIANVFWLNPVLGAFNLVPAFPMDGGRILRASLAFRMDYRKATRISVFFGRVFAILFLLLGIARRHWILALVAVFVYVSAGEEERRVFYEDMLKKLHDNGPQTP